MGRKPFIALSLVSLTTLWVAIDLKFKVRELENMARPERIEQKVDRALDAQREAISRQNSKVLSHTVGVQDRMARIEALVQDLKVEVLLMQADKKENKETVNAEGNRVRENAGRKTTKRGEN